MPRPRKVKLSPHTFAVKYDDNLGAAAGLSGMCDEQNTVIVIDPTFSLTIQRDSLLHEVTHGIWGQTSLDKDYPDHEPASEGEKIITTLAPRFLAFIQDNPAVIAWLQGRDE